MQDDNIHKADIERYALGLTSPREAARIERAMEERPELRQLVEDIQQDLNDYAERIDIPPLRPGTVPNPNRFSELDEEMLDIMSQQNDRLRRWIALVTVLFLVAGSASIYLYYQNSNLSSQLKADRASLRQELNYYHNHLDQAERQMEAWESAAQFVTALPVENLPETVIGLYTFETGEKVMLNVAGVPPQVTSLIVWDERKPQHTIYEIRRSRNDNLHYLNLDNRDQIKWLKIRAVTDTDIALSEKKRN